MADTDACVIAARALPLLDLTNLDDGCSAADIEVLCGRAVTPHGPVAAVCIWPRFVQQARSLLVGTGVRIATVVNFPEGGEDTAAVVAEARQALEDGADEIDLVMPYRAFLDSRKGYAETQIVRVKAAIPAPARLKVILETGILEDPDVIREASELAISAGADFIKTSTGKVAVNATPEAAKIMLETIADMDRNVGFKPAGGIRTVADAGVYLALADEILGADWVSPEHFRFGASGLLDALAMVLDGGDAVSAGKGTEPCCPRKSSGSSATARA
ncbi:deoxyribose-phosphate aldolase [Breoghania sp. L-A4]|uniref:deoxyribose-phosphate aldolase n=1 Tax=Breoghania sp. L-A4 TaxID=2304600 RepID=UPI000E35F7F3|nr:deoxyribose-phosphate aldolase [Breoghania sp. L-A4]AXS39215.1 deoxyribose-phosphate aldolase [Breoghania sp. L-A4]